MKNNKKKNMQQQNTTKDNEFECPICGNILIESMKPHIQCKWCNQTIIPKSRRLNRPADIYVREPYIAEI